MDPESPRWKRITASGFAWEREALDYLCSRLPDEEPYRAWANFEFITSAGGIYEVDVALLTPRGFFVVEIKSWRGELSGDATTWTRRVDGRRRWAVDNPLLLTNRKAKALRSLLANTPSGRRLRRDFPFVEPLVFLSSPGLKVDLDDLARTGVFGRGGLAAGGAAGRGETGTTGTTGGSGESSESGASGGQPGGRRRLPGIVGYLTSTDRREGRGPARPVTSEVARLLSKAMDEAGVRVSRRSLRAGEYELARLLTDGPGFQDFEATHVQLPSVVRRVRIYANPRGSSAEDEASRRRAAEREYLVLQGLRHPGVLPVELLTSHELGPALVFEHDRAFTRLDHWLTEHGESLSLDTRIDIVRQLVDVVRYAHSRRVAHRALNPRSILVGGDPSSPVVKVFSWQTASRAGSGNGATTSLPYGTSHLDALVDEAMGAYLAPEALTNPQADATALDVFSLGAIAYLVLTGQPPAASGLELLDAVRTGNGLQLPAVLDGVGERLREVVANATCPDVVNRYDTVEWLAMELDEAQRELLPPDQAEEVTHPADARPGDRLDDFEVVRLLGKGSTAVAVLVRDEGGNERVLKVALDEGLDEAIRDEAAVLENLTHQAIVRSYRLTEVAGRAAIVLAKAGDTTLARFLREEGTVGVDMLQRWGTDLLDAVVFLELKGSAHRDIKPDNLGIVPVGKNEERHLVLFDFSLSRAALTNIRAGTPPYLEPFLVDRPGRRWDPAAERYAAAVTLYEMAAGTTPVWGDGRSDPASVPGEVTVEGDRFPSSVRDGLVTFFAKALRRDPTERFDTGEDMRRAWKSVFATADTPATATVASEGHEPVDLDVLVRHVDPDSPLAELGLSPRTLDVLERMDVVTVTDLVHAPEPAIRTARAVANKVRRQILDVRAALRRRFPELTGGAPTPRPRKATAEATPTQGEQADVAEARGRARTAATASAAAPAPAPAATTMTQDVQSLDLLVSQLVPRPRRAGGRQAEVVRLLLGLDAPDAARPADAAHPPGSARAPVRRDPSRAWSTQAEVAAAAGMTAARVSQIVGEQRPRWSRNRSLQRLRDEVESLVRGMGGVGTAAEVAEAVASLRGASDSDADLAALGRGAVRAACEVEADAASPRWVQRRTGDVVVLALASGGDTAHDETIATARADWAVRLGRAAAQLAAQDPLPSPATVLARLRAVTPPAEAPLLPDGRLVRFAAAMTDTAAVSARLELYPRGLDCRRAIRLAQNALLVPASRGGPHPHARLSVADVDARLRARYPEMAPLPPRPQLDELLREADVPLEWEDAGEGEESDEAGAGAQGPGRRGEPGGYVMPATRPAGLTSLDASALATSGRVTDADAEAAVVATGERLAHAATAGGFLALTVRLGRVEEAAMGLSRFGVARVSVEARLLARLHEQADAAQVDWAKVVEADAQGPGSPDWRRLLLLMERAWPLVDADVRAAGPAVLLTELGPLARYEAMRWVEAWRDAPLDPASGLRTVWLLVPSASGQDRPSIDGAVVPLIGENQWARLPRPWLEAEAEADATT